MASPPAKRQRRSVVVVSSDAEESGTESQLSSASVNVSTRSLSLRNGAQARKRQHDSNVKAPVETKLKSSKSKSTATKGSRITKNASIYSFFNNTTQNSQRISKPRSPKPQTPDPEPEEPIDDISSDDTGSHHSLPIAWSFNANGKADGQSLHHDSATVRNVGKGRQLSKSKLTSNQEPTSNIITESGPWTDIYPPENLEELGVHKRKVSDVRRWLDNVTKGRERKRLLVLKGPSGSGKTATMRLLAKDLASELIEWQNPVGTSFENEGFISLAAQFDEFLSRTISFQGLDLASIEETKTPEISKPRSGTIVMIEDFPNTFSRGSLALLNFRDSILRYLAASTTDHSTRDKGEQVTPVVMIVTETHMSSSSDRSDSFTVGKLLGRQLMQHPAVTVIDFNPIAPTLLSKALTTIVRKGNAARSKRWSPSASLLKQISQSGDIRNSITSLQLACLFDQDELATKSNKTVSKQEPDTKFKDPGLNMAFRDNIIDLFHAVGKVLYNKRKDTLDIPTPPPTHLGHHHRPCPSEVAIDNLYDDIGTDIDTFVCTLHENYPLSCFGQDFTDNLDDCITNLSDAELFLSSSLARSSGTTTATNPLFQGDYAFNLASRGLLFSLPYPVERGKTMSSVLKLKRDPYKMIYPHSLRLWRQIDETETTLDEWTDFVLRREDADSCSRLSRTEISTEYIPYASKVLPCTKSATRKKISAGLADIQEGDVDEELEASGVMVSSSLEMLLPPNAREASWKGKAMSNGLGQLGASTNSGQLILSDDDIEDD